MTEQWYEQMQKDIPLCKSYNDRQTSRQFFKEIISRYSTYDHDFEKSLHLGGKACIGSEAPDYRPDLKIAATKLESYILSDPVEIETSAKVIVKNDIIKCKNHTSYTDEEADKVRKTIQAKYTPIIEGFETGLQMDWSNQEILIQMAEKLELFLAMGCPEKAHDGIYIDASSSATNQVELNLNISFSEVKEKVENMTSLPKSDIQEALKKIDELESIVKSTERKTAKWEKAKSIIKWIADKGVDVGIAMLPLLLKIQ